jgi:protein-S-isoprenylcysteine O-methyltransferase Ste14
MSADRRSRAVALPLLAGGTAVLLTPMRADVEAQGAFRRSTAAMMWTAYAVGTAAYVDAVRRAPHRASRRTAAGCGTTAVAGAGLLAAGMGAFADPGQITGTDAGRLTTHGVYRFSRNPQYVGIVLMALAGAVASRRRDALALTALLAGAYRAWVPAEERALTRTFGTPYADYLTAAPRWLGLPRSAPPSR